MSKTVQRAREDLDSILEHFETGLTWLAKVEQDLRRTREFRATDDTLDGIDPTDETPVAWLLAGAANGAAESIGQALRDLRAELKTYRDEETAGARCRDERRASRDLEAEVAITRDRRFSPQAGGKVVN